MEKTFLCECCGRRFSVEEQTEFGGVAMCPQCLSERTLVCGDCERRIWREDNEGTADAPLCSTCFNRDYTHCHRCGTLLRESQACYIGDEDSEEAYCSDCYHLLCRQDIHDYYYKPTPIFYGDHCRYYGIELEIDGAGESDINARTLLDIANRDSALVYMKHDGSLEEGFEIVTHPMTLEFHKSSMPWQDVLQKAVEMGYTSHQARTCGLHIHVNRNALGDTEPNQDRAIARILWFFEKNWEELLKFSRRTPRQLERWAARYGLKERPMDILYHAKDHSAGRYVCVNLLNSDTIEFRIFRGTLKYNTLIATLELVDRIIDCALFLSDEEMQQMSWTTFVAGCQTPELVQYLKERRLYINDPVDCSEEV